MTKTFPDLLFVFEMANNHQGDVEHGLRIISEMGQIAGRYGVRAAVKLQYRELDSFIHPDYAGRSDVKHIPRFLSTRLAPRDFRRLVSATRHAGMLTMVTPFDEPSVELALEHEVDILKVASCSANDWPLLEAIAGAGKPVICSTGGKTIHDIDKAVSFFDHRYVTDLALLHCVGLYPTPNPQVQMRFMQRLQQRYRHVAVGYSGHEAPDNLDVVKAAVALGARVLERHVGLPHQSGGLNAYSTDAAQTAAWVESALRMKEIVGAPLAASFEKAITPEEIRSLHQLTRGSFARRALKAGETLGREDVFFAMPCGEGQTTSGEFVEGMTASRDYAEGEALTESRTRGPIEVMREAIHDAKGLLQEAGIQIGSQFEVELSHHHGPQQFRRFGAVIINLLNREYCKKLIVVLPGQHHPGHFHKVKEETFHVLYGELDLILEGTQRHLVAGDMQLIERGQNHEFRSENGCIIEEISTTHVPKDSHYKDRRIASSDPMLRKTLVEAW
ncbi:MAG TPA: N-acetylneuraminate synthase family protein [Vicinamibacteria bacterium]